MSGHDGAGNTAAAFPSPLRNSPDDDGAHRRCGPRSLGDESGPDLTTTPVSTIIKFARTQAASRHALLLGCLNRSQRIEMPADITQVRYCSNSGHHAKYNFVIGGSQRLTCFRKKEPAPTLRTDPTGNDPTCCRGLKFNTVAAPIAATRCILITRSLL